MSKSSKSTKTANTTCGGGSPKLTWGATPADYIAGQVAIDGVDQLAVEMELKWGVDRLRLLVGDELRVKFDQQRYMTNAAIWHGDLADVRRETDRMRLAWHTLDKAAESAGASKLSSEVWEVALADGTVVALVRDEDARRRVSSEGRKVAVYTLAEIGRMISAYPAISRVKKTIPGAEVTIIRRPIGDPLHALRDSDVGLNDDISDLWPVSGPVFTAGRRL
jgi:hypothetical protein